MRRSVSRFAGSLGCLPSRVAAINLPVYSSLSSSDFAKCDGSIASVKIDPQALNPSDAQLLEDMIVTAANQALGQAKDISNTEMGKVTAGLNLPGLG